MNKEYKIRVVPLIKPEPRSLGVKACGDWGFFVWVVSYGLWDMSTEPWNILIKSYLSREMQDFRNINVWEQAHKLVLKLYKKTESYPSTEKYRIVDQLLRAAISVPTNIAEGASRSSDADFARFINFAIASASETEYLLLLSKELGMISSIEYDEFSGEIIAIRKMLINLTKKLKTK